MRKFEGNPEHPGSPRAQLREGAGDAQPGDRPGPYPLPAQARRRARRGQVGAGRLGRGARRHRRAHPQGHRREPAQRGDVPRRPARRGRLHRAHPRRLGRGRAQLAHEHLLVFGARAATSTGWGSTARARITRTPTSSCSSARTSNPGHYFNPHAQRIMEAQAARREAHRLRHAAVEHGDARRPLGLALSRLRGGDPARRRATI